MFCIFDEWSSCNTQLWFCHFQKVNLSFTFPFYGHSLKEITIATGGETNSTNCEYRIYEHASVLLKVNEFQAPEISPVQPNVYSVLILDADAIWTEPLHNHQQKLVTC